MTSEQQSKTGIPPGWERIWIGAALLGFACLLLLPLADTGTAAEGAWVLLVLIFVSGFFGVVHLMIGCVMQGLALHERTKATSDQT